MDGPTFLFVYALVALAVIAAARWFLWIGDRTGWLAPPPVPANFDPYEIAYLRGGKNAVLRTILYDLYRRGLIEIIPAKWFKATKVVAREIAAGNDGQRGRLTGLEGSVLAKISTPAEPSALFRTFNNTLPRDVEWFCEPFRIKLQSEKLFRSDTSKHAARFIPWAATAFIVLVGLARFAGSSPGAHVKLLFIVMVVAVVLLWVLAGNRAMADISERGRAWLKQIQTAYQGADMSPVAKVGLFGITVLNDTPDAEFAKLFAKGNDGSGCGGGCGSGCGGGCGGD
jgi:uncharacterized protein (TIGR04222 family)